MVIGASTSRAARGLLDWTQIQLAAAAGVNVSMLRNFEAGRNLPSAAHLLAIQRALEAAEVEFLPEGGVRLHPDPITFGPDYVVDRYKFRIIANRRNKQIIVDVPRETVDDAGRSTAASTAERCASFEAHREDFEAYAIDLLRSQAPGGERVSIYSTTFEGWKPRTF